jgi:diguanylate cyclase (GGDEF)-like protein
MPEPIRFVMATSLVQLAACLLMAGVLVSFWRTYGRRYLLHIAWSWLALGVMFGGSTVALWAAFEGLSPLHPARLGATIISQGASYLQALLLLVGSYEVAQRRVLGGRWLAMALVPIGALAVVLSLIYADVPDASQQRFFLRVGVRAAVLGVAFVAGGIALAKTRLHERGLGLAIVCVAFILYGAQQLHVFAAGVYQLVTGDILWYAPLLSFVDFFLLVAIGLGTVVWMLEAERQRTLRAVREVDELSHFDHLTRLPNRQQLLARLDLALADARGSGLGLAIIALDLDGFRAVNDSLGRHIGDEVLRAVAARLTARPYPPVVVARVGSDEFVLVVDGVSSDRDLRARADDLATRVRRPMQLGGQELYLTASIGAARFPDHGVTSTTLVHAADAALHAVQQAGRDEVQLFHADLQSLTTDRLRFETSLRRALEVRQFRLLFQPILSVPDRRLEGFEALIRWEHPTRGLLAPDEFLGVAEAIGTLQHLEWWVVESACNQLVRWRTAGAHQLTISINLSPNRFQSSDLRDRLVSLCHRVDLPPQSIQLEITEGSALHQTEPTMEVLRTLRTAGFRIAIDDFGTGYSSLSLLRSLPVDQLKIDRSFIRTLGTDSRDEAVVSAIVTLAHGFGLPVVAEGVERENQHDAIRRAGCDLAQGFLYSPPVGVEACDAILAAHGLVDEGRRSHPGPA